MAEGLGRRAHLGGLERARRPPPGVRARDAPVPVRRAAHRAPEGLLGGRRRGPLRAPQRQPSPQPDGLRRVRAAGREPRHQDRPASARVHRGGDPRVPAPVPRVGHLDRLDARAQHARSRVLPLDAVALPAPVRARARVPQGGRGQVVPEGPDRPRQRAGDRRALRALRQHRRGQAARAVVLPHHRVRGPPAGGHAAHRVAAARGHDAGELDRPLGGRRGGVPLRGAGDRLSRLHHPSGHDLRRDLLRAGARAPGRAAPERLARGARLREPLAQRNARGARRRAQAEDGRAARPHRHEPGHGRADPHVGRGLRADGVRHRRGDGRAGARRARLRVRRAVRTRDPARDRLRGAALHRRRPDGELGPLRRAEQPRGLRPDRRLARVGGQGQALGELPPARLAAVAAALLGLPDPDALLRDGRPRAGAGRPAAGGAARTSRTTSRRGSRRSRPPPTG